MNNSRENKLGLFLVSTLVFFPRAWTRKTSQLTASVTSRKKERLLIGVRYIPWMWRAPQVGVGVTELWQSVNTKHPIGVNSHAAVMFFRWVMGKEGRRKKKRLMGGGGLLPWWWVMWSINYFQLFCFDTFPAAPRPCHLWPLAVLWSWIPTSRDVFTVTPTARSA